MLQHLNRIDEMLTGLQQTWNNNLAAKEQNSGNRDRPFMTPSTSVAEGMAFLDRKVKHMNSRLDHVRRIIPNKTKDNFENFSLQQLLASQLTRPSLSTETADWRLRTGMARIELRLDEYCDWVNELEDLASGHLDFWIQAKNECLGVERDETFQDCIRWFHAVERLDADGAGDGVLDVLDDSDDLWDLDESKLSAVAVARYRSSMAVIDEVIHNITTATGQSVQAFIDKRNAHDSNVLELLHYASEMGLHLPRQTLIDEYFPDLQ